MTWPNRLGLMHCDDDDGASPSGCDVNLAVAKQLLLNDKDTRHGFDQFRSMSMQR